MKFFLLLGIDLRLVMLTDVVLVLVYFLTHLSLLRSDVETVLQLILDELVIMPMIEFFELAFVLFV